MGSRMLRGRDGALYAWFEGGIERDGHGGIVTLGLDAVGWHPRFPHPCAESAHKWGTPDFCGARVGHSPDLHPLLY